MDRRTELNLEVLGRITNSKPVLIDVLPSSKAIPDMRDDMLLHAGSPIELKDIPGPMWGAIIGALLYEGKADTPDNARKLVERGEIALEPCHHHGAVGPMSGITSPSMPVFVVRNEPHGNYAYCNINEGVGRTKTLRFGAFDVEIIERMKWMEETLGPALSASLKEL
ncbi:MAG: DUF1116 domain-containing protein, partial [Candidatus Bathyarchaeia archaeon]